MLSARSIGGKRFHCVITRPLFISTAFQFSAESVLELENFESDILFRFIFCFHFFYCTLFLIDLAYFLDALTKPSYSKTNTLINDR